MILQIIGNSLGNFWDQVPQGLHKICPEKKRKKVHINQNIAIFYQNTSQNLQRTTFSIKQLKTYVLSSKGRGPLVVGEKGAELNIESG
jgi:hypothetical protein